MMVSDHQGTDQYLVLQWLHEWYRPEWYLEIGTSDGASLRPATCPSVAIDPAFMIKDGSIVTNKPECHLYQQTSDDFFAREDIGVVLRQPVDLVFLDGMHLCEFLLRDFINIEPYCRPDSVVVLHDCLPVEDAMADRDRDKAINSLPHHQGWWTGDVWRTALALKRFRPDLQISAFDAPPTGLITVTGLDPGSRLLAEPGIPDAMMSWTLDQQQLFGELGVESTRAIDSEDKLRRRFPRLVR
jgi:hypothetical protein